MSPVFSLLVPVLDEEAGLPELLDHLEGLAGSWEVILADGGSRDRTVTLAAARTRVIDAPRGRAAQMNAAARVASGEALVFLHADSRLPPGAHASIVRALEDPLTVGGNFVLRFDGDDRFARLLGAWYRLQRRAGVYYGDSTIWVRRDAFDALGGFRDLAIMEDYDFVRRLERHGRTACLPGPAVTSGRRWRTHGVPRTVATWVLIRWAWLAGVPADRLARLYRAVR
ncbi:MAG: TIGR04283 family arsenosugar biosynthesis glycosyltransferase [Solirubrobacteraceae bacterium]